MVFDKITGKVKFMETIAKITIRCFFLNFIVLLIWLLFYILAGDFMYRAHSSFFEMTKQEFAVINYCGIMLVKIFTFTFFLFPFVACKLCMKKQS
jgi:hypothetical protein